jgi:hypothetical protein
MTDLTIDTKTLVAARTSIARLNSQLAELRQEEQRCQIKRSRLEAEHARVQALIDLCELVERCNGMDVKPLVRVVPLDPEVPDGVKLVVPAKLEELVTYPEATEGLAKVVREHARKQVKPDGLPTLVEMIVAVLAEAAKQGRDSLAPREIRAAIRKRWWPDAPHHVVSSAVWRLGNMDRLRKVGAAGTDRQYGLIRQPAAYYEDAS